MYVQSGPFEKVKTGERNSGIDALRGISILSVILLHLNIRVPFSETYIGSNLPETIYRIIFWSGYYGVAVFFVISGFLITTTTLNRWNSLPQIDLKGFYLMRMSRIIPLLLLLILILSFLHIFSVKGFIINPERTTLGRSVLAALTFHVNLLEIKVGYLPASWDILWSLSIEEVFYLFFPVLCFFCRKEWHFAAIVSIFFLISPLARTTWYPGNDLADKNHFAYLDAISLGCIAAIIAARVKIKRGALTGVAFTGWSLFIIVFIFRKWVSMLGITKTGLNITLLALGVALILVWMQIKHLNGEMRAMGVSLPLRFLGRNSYEIYLTHMFVVLILTDAIKTLSLSGEWVTVLYIVTIPLSAYLGYLVSRYFTTPVNFKLRSSFRN